MLNPPMADDEQIRQIHAQAASLAIAITGGGSLAIGQLLAVPGGSRTLLEAVVPYSAAALREYLKAPPEQYCSPRAARAMAMTAYQRALRLSASGSVDATRRTLIGVGCTASLVSDRAKQGPHRIHLAWQTAGETHTRSLELAKGRRTRRGEEELAAALVLDSIAMAVGICERTPLSLLEIERVQEHRTTASAAWRRLLAGETSIVSAHPPKELGDLASDRATARDGTGPELNRVHRAIFPGSFNPRHAGHRKMAEIAERRLGLPVEHEISIENVDKPPLNFTEMADAAAQFSGDETLWFTRSATFIEKSAIFPRSTFIVGADTLARLADPRYYGGSSQSAAAAIETLVTAGCRFLIFGRTSDQEFRTLAELPIPNSLKSICQQVPETEFRVDISSTQMRATSA